VELPTATWARRLYGEDEDGWLPWIQDAQGVVSGAWVSAAEAATRPEALLESLAPRLKPDSVVTLLLPGALDLVDLHRALPARPDGELWPVRWSVDRPASARAAAPGGARRAVVVGDPGGGLAEARAEAASVAAALRADGFEVTELGRGTRLPDLLTALGGDGVELLHFAGHGEVGEDAWDARLVLAGGAVFGVRDVLSLAHPPRRVVLTGCETARTDGEALAGMGLATAFIVAGTEQVIATARKVDDAVARRFSEQLYRRPDRYTSPERAFAAAVSATARDTPDADVGGFRLIVR
jgi:hypothetical protein